MHSMQDMGDSARDAIRVKILAGTKDGTPLLKERGAVFLISA